MSFVVKCPDCGHAFYVDEQDCVDVIKQIQDQYLNRVKVEAAEHVRSTEENKWRDVIAKKDVEQSKLISEKDAEIAVLKEKLSGDVEKAVAEYKLKVQRSESTISEVAAEKDKQIVILEEKLKSAESVALAEKDQQIADLKVQLEKSRSSVLDTVRNAIAAKDEEIGKLKSEVTSVAMKKDLEYSNAMQELRTELETSKSTHALEVEQLNKEIDFYKDFRNHRNTKMIGESLEQYCSDLFESVRPVAFRTALFEKDNDTSANGQKGDFIFRDFDESGIEYISIMFEMKNESDESTYRHKNADFYKKLDSDRKAKNCEYAVLVSTLEPDNDVFNAGIADVSHLYEKMYVVRPQSMIAIISLLRNSAMSTIGLRRSLEETRKEDVDFDNFIDNMTKFKDSFSQSYDRAKKNFDATVAAIDKAIKDLQTARDKLTLCSSQLDTANNKVDGLTVKKLTYNAPTVRDKIKQE